MIYNIIVSRVASKNIADAVNYYMIKANKKVALDFLKDFEKINDDLKINPLYQFHDLNYRFLPFSKFPYVAFFIVDEMAKTVFLNAVFHTSQEPDILKFSK